MPHVTVPHLGSQSISAFACVSFHKETEGKVHKQENVAKNLTKKQLLMRVRASTRPEINTQKKFTGLQDECITLKQWILCTGCSYRILHSHSVNEERSNALPVSTLPEIKLKYLIICSSMKRELKSLVLSMEFQLPVWKKGISTGLHLSSVPPKPSAVSLPVSAAAWLHYRHDFLCMWHEKYPYESWSSKSSSVNNKTWCQCKCCHVH